MFCITALTRSRKAIVLGVPRPVSVLYVDSLILILTRTLEVKYYPYFRFIDEESQVQEN